jgi:hypothetical protein
MFAFADFGYDISDYEAIQPEYGTMEDFDELIAKAKELGKKRNCTNDLLNLPETVVRLHRYKDYFGLCTQPLIRPARMVHQVRSERS